MGHGGVERTDDPSSAVVISLRSRTNNGRCCKALVTPRLKEPSNSVKSSDRLLDNVVGSVGSDSSRSTSPVSIATLSSSSGMGDVGG
jgi:hypothetical protein